VRDVSNIILDAGALLPGFAGKIASGGRFLTGLTDSSSKGIGASYQAFKNDTVKINTLPPSGSWGSNNVATVFSVSQLNIAGSFEGSANLDFSSFENTAGQLGQDLTAIGSSLTDLSALPGSPLEDQISFEKLLSDAVAINSSTTGLTQQPSLLNLFHGMLDSVATQTSLDSSAPMPSSTASNHLFYAALESEDGYTSRFTFNSSSGISQFLQSDSYYTLKILTLLRDTLEVLFFKAIRRDLVQRSPTLCSIEMPRLF
jgi:hypothetical protein